MKSKRIQALILAAAVGAGLRGRGGVTAPGRCPSVPVATDFGPDDGLTRYVLTRRRRATTAGLLAALDARRTASSVPSACATAAPWSPPRACAPQQLERSPASPTPSSRPSVPVLGTVTDPLLPAVRLATWTTPARNSYEQAGGAPTPTSTPPRAGTAAPATGWIVAVVDTGYDSDHADLAGALWTNPAESCGVGRHRRQRQGRRLPRLELLRPTAPTSTTAHRHARHVSVSGVVGARANNGHRRRRRRPRRDDHAAGHRQRVARSTSSRAPRRSATPSTTAPTSSTPPGAAPSAAGALDSAAVGRRLRRGPRRRSSSPRPATTAANRDTSSPMYPASLTDPNVITVGNVRRPPTRISSSSAYGAALGRPLRPGRARDRHHLERRRRTASSYGHLDRLPASSPPRWRSTGAAMPTATAAEVKQALLDDVDPRARVRRASP